MAEPRTLLVIVRHLGMHGPAIQMVTLSTAWARQGHRCMMLDLVPEERDAELIERRLHPHVKLVEGIPAEVLIDFAVEHGIDRVISVGRACDEFVSKCLQVAPVKPEGICFISRQTGSYFYEKDKSKIRSNLGPFDGHVIQNEDQTNLLLSLGFDERRIQFIHNGVEISSDVGARSGLGDGQRSIRIAMCARGAAGKGWATAIGAIRLLIAEGENLELRLIGSGDGLDALKHWASDRILFLGGLADPGEELAACAIGLLPTSAPSEGLPNSILDYFAAGLPVIASEIGGIPTLINDPSAPAGTLLRDPRDAGECADAIRNYLHDPALFERHASGVRAMQKRIDIDLIAAQWIAWMDGVAGMGSGRSGKGRLDW